MPCLAAHNDVIVLARLTRPKKTLITPADLWVDTQWPGVMGLILIPVINLATDHSKVFKGEAIKTGINSGVRAAYGALVLTRKNVKLVGKLQI